MPSIFDKVRSMVPREGPEELEREFEEELEECKKQTGEEKEGNDGTKPKGKGDKCDVCGKPLRAELMGGNFGGRCRICQRECCSAHYKEGLCPFCKEKLGKADKDPKNTPSGKSSIF